MTLAAAATSIVAAGGGTCAQLVDGTVQCWGLNDMGRFGDGTSDGSLTPTTLAGFTGVDEIARSADGGCARRGTEIQCWGAGELLGNGDYSTAMPMPPSGCE